MRCLKGNEAQLSKWDRPSTLNKRRPKLKNYQDPEFGAVKIINAAYSAWLKRRGLKESVIDGTSRILSSDA